MTTPATRPFQCVRPSTAPPDDLPLPDHAAVTRLASGSVPATEAAPFPALPDGAATVQPTHPVAGRVVMHPAVAAMKAGQREWAD